MWSCNYFVYYAFSYNIGDYGGNFYITFMLSGLVEMPSQLLCALFLKFIGRRPLLIVFMVMTTISCLSIIFVESDWSKVTLALIGKFAVTSSENVMSIHAPEMFPTVVRNIALGAGTVVSTIVSLGAPFIRDLVIIEFYKSLIKNFFYYLVE